MGSKISGFSAAQNVKLQNAISTGAKAVDVAYKKMTTIMASKVVDKPFRDFFGVGSTTRIARVYERLNMMNYAMNSASIDYIRSTGRGSVYAAAQRPSSDWSEKDVRQMLEQGAFKMKIDDLFYGPNTDKRLMALTIVHEMSHLVANTDDVVCPWDNKDCYELARCRRLASQYPDLATQNADSYAFFVMAEYDGVLLNSGNQQSDADLSGINRMFSQAN